MEISIDVGKHVVDEIQNIAQSENKDFDVISSKILELGLRVYQSSKSEDNDKKHDPLLVNIFRKNAESNLLIKEIIGHIFDKNRSNIKAYDHSSVIHAIEKTVHFYMQENDLL
jgi:hypothetical protein